MGREDSANWLATAVEQFERRSGRKDGVEVVRCLGNGLSLLRDSLYDRVHSDVERVVGRDSMLMPVSEIKAKQRTIREIEAYQTAEATAAAVAGRYVRGGAAWFGPWLAQMRSRQCAPGLEVGESWKDYFEQDPDDRRHRFMDQLTRAMPEARKAPLVLFRLVPLAVRIAVAAAFADRAGAAELRQEQIAILPAIADCRQCRGQVLECIEQCPSCGNPLWKHPWLVATD